MHRVPAGGVRRRHETAGGVPMSGPEGERAAAGPPLLWLGLRPFYLLAALLAALWVPLWVAVVTGHAPAVVWAGPVLWHGHEMVYGFVAAVMSGFLLTAVRNWTGRPTPTGLPLGLLALLWIAGRALMLAADAVPGWLVAAVDVAFLPAVAAALLPPLLRTRNRRNLVFPVVLLALAGANLAMHLQALGVLAGAAQPALRFALDAILVVMVVIGGRVIPSFTANALPGAGVRGAGAVDRLAVALVVLLLVLRLAEGGGVVTGAAALAAALANAARMLGWRAAATRRTPILWILHAGYAWIVVALVLDGLAALDLGATRAAAVHALTVGAIGSLTLGMMTRSALGHTGRALRAPPATAVAYGLVNAAALVRVFLPLAAPGWYLDALLVSGLAWSAAFALFVIGYWPVLSRPRLDGRPG